MNRSLGFINGGGVRSALAKFGLITSVVWLIVDSFTGHPHYLSHFNELAFGRPERIVLDSDLDWGQGIFELERTCRERKIQRLQVYYFGTALLEKYRLPKQPSSEDSDFWIAISVTLLFRHAEFEKFRERGPDAIVDGGSIWLYRISRSSEE